MKIQASSKVQEELAKKNLSAINTLVIKRNSNNFATYNKATEKNITNIVKTIPLNQEHTDRCICA